MSVFLAFQSEREDELVWVTDPVININDTCLEFTTTSAKVVISGKCLEGMHTPSEYVELAIVKLSRIGVSPFSLSREITRGVCIHGPFVSVPFTVSGPFPHRLLTHCRGERVDGPNGFFTSYGG